MPTPGELVAKFSEVLHVGQNTMTVFNRVLADAEPPLLPKGARGVNAVHRTPLDAARLLIALLSTSSPTRAAEVVRDFGTLECHDHRDVETGTLTLAALCGPEFDGPHSFENALAALIGGFGHEDFRDILEANASDNGVSIVYPFIGARVRENKLDAEINVAGNAYYYSHRDLREANRLLRLRAAENSPDALEQSTAAMGRYLAAAAKYAGINTERSITINEIKPIAEFVCTPPKRAASR